MELHIRVETLVRSFDACIGAVIPGMTYSEFRTLVCVSRFGPLSLKHISDIIALPKTTMHYTLNKMEAAGHIERAMGKRKGTPVFTITPTGQAAWEQGSLALLRTPWSSALLTLETEALEHAVIDLRLAWEGLSDAKLEEALRLEAAFVGTTLADPALQRDAEQQPTAGPAGAPAEA